jgi:hypothetical protein
LLSRQGKLTGSGSGHTIVFDSGETKEIALQYRLQRRHTKFKILSPAACKAEDEALAAAEQRHAASVPAQGGIVAPRDPGPILVALRAFIDKALDKAVDTPVQALQFAGAPQDGPRSSLSPQEGKDSPGGGSSETENQYYQEAQQERQRAAQAENKVKEISKEAEADRTRLEGELDVLRSTAGAGASDAKRLGVELKEAKEDLQQQVRGSACMVAYQPLHS